MTPWSLLLPSVWSQRLEALMQGDAPLWIHGEAGSGATTLAQEAAQRRGVAWVDDGDTLAAAALGTWLAENPRGVLSAHGAPPEGFPGAAFALPTLDEVPERLPALLEAMAREENVPGPLPPELAQLPCPGNLRGLRNRLLRWKLLGQLPPRPPEAGADAGATTFQADAEDLATNLHRLEAFLLHRALRRSYGNRVEAAKRLGVSRRQLYLLIERHGDPVRGEPPTAPPPKRLQKRMKGPSQ